MTMTKKFVDLEPGDVYTFPDHEGQRVDRDEFYVCCISGCAVINARTGDVSKIPYGSEPRAKPSDTVFIHGHERQVVATIKERLAREAEAALLTALDTYRSHLRASVRADARLIRHEALSSLQDTERAGHAAQNHLLAYVQQNRAEWSGGPYSRSNLLEALMHDAALAVLKERDY